MKLYKIDLQISLIFFAMVVAGCNQLAQHDTPSFTPTDTLQAEKTAPPSAATLTPTIAATPTVIPTLSPEQARQYLLDLLSNNGNCHLPCLWGITPGISTSQDARSILTPLSALSDLTRFIDEGGVVSPNYVEQDLILATNIGFNTDILSDNQVVSRISFRARELKEVTTTDNGLGFELIFDSDIFSQRLNFYMLHSVLTNYGHPQSVMLGTVASIPPREPAGGFHILLLYPKQGMLLEYTTQMYKNELYVSGCPTNAHVEMNLYPPTDSDSFFALLEETGGDEWAVKKNWYQPLEETTSISIDEFYEIYREPTDKCIESLASLWPIPDP